MAEEKWVRETPLTLKIRSILVMLRLMKEQLTRVVIHITLNFKTATIKGGGRPKASKHKMSVH